MDLSSSSTEGKVNFSQNIVNAMCCPILLKPYKKAQTVNCNWRHSFSLKVVQEIFGNMQNGNCEKADSCPLCRERVTAYYANTSLQSLVDALLGEDQEQPHLDKMFEIVRKLKMDFDIGVAYPVAKTHFEVRESYFTKEHVSLNLIKKDRNQCVDSGIEILGIQTFNEGSRVRIQIGFNDSQFAAKCKMLTYLEKNSLSSFQETPAYQALVSYLDCKEAIACLRLLMQSNEFDDNSKTLLTRFLEFCEGRLSN